jgi:hypothetical protein
VNPDPELPQPGFFIKLAEIPNLLEELQNPDSDVRSGLETNAPELLQSLGISVPPGLVPDQVTLPPAERVTEIVEALNKLKTQAGDEFFWFPWFAIGGGGILWFPFAWFPFFSGEGEPEA